MNSDFIITVVMSAVIFCFLVLLLGLKILFPVVLIALIITMSTFFTLRYLLEKLVIAILLVVILYTTFCIFRADIDENEYSLSNTVTYYATKLDGEKFYCEQSKINNSDIGNIDYNDKIIIETWKQTHLGLLNLLYGTVRDSNERCKIIVTNK